MFRKIPVVCTMRLCQRRVGGTMGSLCVGVELKLKYADETFLSYVSEAVGYGTL